MPISGISKAWITLAVLSAATTLLTLLRDSNEARSVIAAAVLLLAGLKARVILTRYLALASSRFWMRTFDLAIGGFLIVAYGLYLAGRTT